MLTEEQKARLDPEQLKIAEGWEKEKDERGLCLDKMMEASDAKDDAAYKEALTEYLKINQDKTHCEHERSIWSNCAACDEISQLLHPEFFCSECNEAFDEEELNLVQGVCDYCSQEKE